MDNILPILELLGKSIVIPVIVSILTTIITNKINYIGKCKEQLPKLRVSMPNIVGYMPSKGSYEEDAAYINGYYKMQRDFDNELMEFLLLNNEDINFNRQHIMELILEEAEGLNQSHEPKEIAEVVTKFKNNKKFLEILNRYKAYYNSSKWNLTIENIGESDAYDLKMNMFKESNSCVLLYNGTLEKGEKRRVNLFYFDSTMIIDEKYSASWSSEVCTKFYLTDKKKYNKKDERLFKMTYKDKYNKSHEIYCCAYIVKREEAVPELLNQI